MNILAIQPANTEETRATVVFEGFGGIQVDTAVLLDRRQFLNLVHDRFDRRGVDDAPAYDDDWREFILDVVERTRPLREAADRKNTRQRREQLAEN